MGKGNPFSEPSDEVVGRLEQKLSQGNTYRADEHGTIELITDGGRL